ncbi:MAG: hypothetical protein R2684_09600 [Pyrinomonadaceae bacterium]
MTKVLNTLVVFFVILIATVTASAQLRTRTSEKSTPPPISAEIRATPAFAEILLRRTELESTLEEMLVTYTDEFPRVISTRYELGLINAELTNFGKMKSTDAPKLTLALGKLLVKRAELATNYWVLANKYNDQHPDSKKAKKKLEIYDRAISEIL